MPFFLYYKLVIVLDLDSSVVVDLALHAQSIRPYLLDMLLLRQKSVQTRVGWSENKTYSEMMPYLTSTQLLLCLDLKVVQEAI